MPSFWFFTSASYLVVLFWFLIYQMKSILPLGKLVFIQLIASCGYSASFEDRVSWLAYPVAGHNVHHYYFVFILVKGGITENQVYPATTKVGSND